MFEGISTKRLLFFIAALSTADCWARGLCKSEPYSKIETAFMRIADTATMQKKHADEAAADFDKDYQYSRNVNWSARGFTGVGILLGTFSPAAPLFVAGSSYMTIMNSALAGIRSVDEKREMANVKKRESQSRLSIESQKKQAQEEIDKQAVALREVVGLGAGGQDSSAALANILDSIQKTNGAFTQEAGLVRDFFSRYQAMRSVPSGNGLVSNAINVLGHWAVSPLGGDAAEYWKRHFEEQVALSQIAAIKLAWAEQNLLATRSACGASSPTGTKVIDEAESSAHGG